MPFMVVLLGKPKAYIYVNLLSASLFSFFGSSTLVGQRPMKSFSSVYPSVCPSVHPSLNCLKIGSLVFSDIVQDDTWPWYLVTDETRFLNKIFGSPNMGPMGLNQAQNEVFHHFLEFGLYVFLEFAYNDSFQQYLTSSRGKTHEKNFGAQIWAKQTKLGPKLGFLPFSEVWFISFPLNCIW